MRILLSFVLLCVSGPHAALAQGNPRDFGRDMGRERLEYYAQVQKEVYERVLLRWKRAAETDDVATLARFYDENATYFPPGSAYLQTRAAIADYFKSFLASAGDVSIRLIDFGTSGDLAYVTAGMSFYVFDQATTGREVARTDLIVLRRRANGDWQIQTHFSREDS